VSRRYELSEEQSGLIEDLLPARGKRGGRWKEHRTVLDGVFRMLHTGAQWRELPERYGSRSTAHDRLTRWREDGTLDRMLERPHLTLDERGRIETDLRPVDATVVRAGRPAAGGRRPAAGGRRPAGGGRRPGGKRRPASPTTTPWAAPAAGTAPRCTRPSTAAASLWRRRSRRGRPTSPSTWSRPSEPSGSSGPAGAGPAPGRRPWPATRAAATGRSGLISAAGGPGDPGGHPDAEGPEAEPAVRQAGLPPPQRRRALRRPAQGVPSARHPL